MEDIKLISSISRKMHPWMQLVKIIYTSADACMLHTMQVFYCNPTHDQSDGNVASVGQKPSSAHMKFERYKGMLRRNI